MIFFLSFLACAGLANVILYLCARPSIRRRKRTLHCTVIVKPVALSPLDVEELRKVMEGGAE